MKVKKSKTQTQYEGKQDYVRKLKLPKIDAFKNIYPDRDYSIEFEIPEFTCVCPKTGLPDFAVLKIAYKPKKYCVELKSFKEYLLSFRNVGIFHENLVNRLHDDLQLALKAKSLRVEGKFNPRGGIYTTVVRES